MLLPALGKAQDKAREISCRSNLKQLGLITIMYSMDWEDYVYCVQWGDNRMYYRGLMDEYGMSPASFFCPATECAFDMSKAVNAWQQVGLGFNVSTWGSGKWASERTKQSKITDMASKGTTSHVLFADGRPDTAQGVIYTDVIQQGTVAANVFDINGASGDYDCPLVPRHNKRFNIVCIDGSAHSLSPQEACNEVKRYFRPTQKIGRAHV